MNLLRRVREPFSGVSHGIGVPLAVVALFVLLAASWGKPRHLVGFAIYGVSLIALYAASALYHSLHVGPRALAWLQRLDHSAIFLLIAGSYTPFCLVTLHGVWGWSLLGVVYALAAIGVVLSLFGHKLPEWPRVTLYLVMGWLSVLAFGPLRDHLPPAGLDWLIAGGIVYSLGAVIFATDKPHLWPGKFSAHDLWHLFVLGGSACHFIVLLLFVAPTL